MICATPTETCHADCADLSTRLPESRTFTPPFRVRGDTVVDRYDRHICEVDPHGIEYSDALRREIAQGIADALNGARGVLDTDAQAAK